MNGDKKNVKAMGRKMNAQYGHVLNVFIVRMRLHEQQIQSVRCLLLLLLSSHFIPYISSAIVQRSIIRSTLRLISVILSCENWICVC